MKILVLNSGSSSVKYQAFDLGKSHTCLVKGLVDRIGLDNPAIEHSVPGRDTVEMEIGVPDHSAAIQRALDLLTDTTHGVIHALKEIEGVGHRVVHGGEKFHQSVFIDDAVLQAIRECCEIAPLHNPPNLLGIEACFNLLPGVPQVAVFDTAFHQTMPPRAYAYGLPCEMYKEHAVRKYGFHGTSHQFVAGEAARILGKPVSALNLITCHLGNGCSVAAVKGGVSVDTSMGFTPLEGLVMGTRCGDLDPYVPLYLMEKEGMDIEGMRNFLNKKSGLKGICGNSDMRDILHDAAAGSEPAKLAIEVFTYRVAKYIGAYAVAMGGVDAIVFTAGMGEKSAVIREKILSYLSFLGLQIDKERNDRHETLFSTPDSKIAALMIPTNEELVIARDTYRLIQ